MFAVPFDEIAPIVDRTPDGARQLASRARRRVQGAEPDADADLARAARGRRRVPRRRARRRLRRARSRCSIPTSLRVDAGPDSPLAHAPLVGREAVLAEAQRWSAMAPYSRPAIVNGVAGAVIGRPGHPFAVVAVTIASGCITALDFVVDPAKLARITI